VRALAAASLVVAQRNGADRRRVELRILPAGQAVLRKAPPPFIGVVPVALAGLDAETLQRLETDLGRLIELLHADRRAAGVPLAEI
jgi:DNA-binding MarR family transcriptional regulator